MKDESANSLLSLDNPVMSSYAFYAALLTIKMFVVAILTARRRLTKKVFPNPEDAASYSGKAILGDPDVERIRRIHLNDMENILPFLTLGLLTVLTSSMSASSAIWHFRVFFAARMLHMTCYLMASMPAPRAVSFLTGVFVCISMAIQIIIAVC